MKDESKFIEPVTDFITSLPTLRISKRLGDAEITVEIAGLDKVLPTCGDLVVFTKAVLGEAD